MSSFEVAPVSIGSDLAPAAGLGRGQLHNKISGSSHHAWKNLKVNSKMFYFEILVAFLAFSLVQSRPAWPGRNINGFGVPISNPNATNIIPGKYIVVYNENATDDAVQLHQESVMKAFRKRGLYSSINMRTFSITGWRGMTLEAADDEMVIDIANATEVWLIFISKQTTDKIRSITSKLTP